MNTKHTEGKLHVSTCCPCQVKSESRAVVADTWYDNSVNLEEAKANAERLALAWNLLPEMTESLKHAVSDIECLMRMLEKHADISCKGGNLEFSLNQIRATLAKATNPNAGVKQVFEKGRW